MEYYLDGMTDAEINLYKYLQKFENEKFIVIPNLMIERKGLGTNQYDFVIITDRGIFIIEFKDYSGAIYGNEYNKNWKVYYKNGYNKSFRNPVKQNENRKKTLTSLLDQNNFSFPIFNVVVFGDNSPLNKIDSTVPVIKKENIVQTVNKNQKLMLEEKTLINLKNLLLINNITSNEERKKHIEFISSISSSKIKNSKEKNYEDYNKYEYKKENIYADINQGRNKSKKIMINKKVVILVLFLILWVFTSFGNDKPQNNVTGIQDDNSISTSTGKNSSIVKNEIENEQTEENIGSGLATLF